MLEKKIGNLLRRLLPIDRYLFHKISSNLALHLDYAINKDAVRVLESIMIDREYAAYFPFYRQATILDIGAHYGYFSLFASLNTAPQSRILAIEPSSSNFKILRQNLKAAGADNVQTIQAAIAAHSQTQTLHQSHSFNHSLFTDNQGVKEEVSGINLADLFEREQLTKIDFLKIDCEGAEYPILLETAPAVLFKVQTISLEFHDLRKEGYAPNDLVAHLRNCGFVIVKFTYDPDYSISNLNFGKLIATRMDGE